MHPATQTNFAIIPTTTTGQPRATADTNDMCLGDTLDLRAHAHIALRARLKRANAPTQVERVLGVTQR